MGQNINILLKNFKKMEKRNQLERNKDDVYSYGENH